MYRFCPESRGRLVSVLISEWTRSPHSSQTVLFGTEVGRDGRNTLVLVPYSVEEYNSVPGLRDVFTNRVLGKRNQVSVHRSKTWGPKRHRSRVTVYTGRVGKVRQVPLSYRQSTDPRRRTPVSLGVSRVTYFGGRVEEDPVNHLDPEEEISDILLLSYKDGRRRTPRNRMKYRGVDRYGGPE